MRLQVAQKYVFLVAAEPSGDLHAGHVARALMDRDRDIHCAAFGGDAMRRAGVEVLTDLTGWATMVLGFAAHVGRYRRLLERFDRMLVEKRPAAVVLIDSPGLNFLLARLAKWRGIPVIYYVCPQIWAWGPWRRAKIERYTDLVLSILPFEVDLFAGTKVAARHVGHPLPDELAPLLAEDPSALRAGFGVGAHERLIAVLPGSREQEVSGLGSAFLRLVARAAGGRAGVRVFVSAYRDAFRPLLADAARESGVDVEIVPGDARKLMRACDLAVVASGTASLELAAFGKPMLVLYRTSPMGRAFFRYFGVTPWIALPNILGARANGGEATVHEELFTREPSARAVEVASQLLFDSPQRTAALERLGRLERSFLQRGGVERAAVAIHDFLESRSG